MCFTPKVPKDNSAQIAGEKEAERQARIKEGQSNIDSAFEQFNDPYYEGVTTDYNSYYNPQVEQQYKDALDKLTLQLGQQGILQSSAGNEQIGKLTENYGKQKQTVADAALNAANDARARIQQQKTNLYSQNTAAADPSQAASLAATAAQSAISPPVYSPLGNLFAGLLGSGTNALAVQQGGTINTAGPSNQFGVFSNPLKPTTSGNAGSGTVVL